MHIRKLRLFDFKNYHEVNVVFSPYINCITGLNGSGKTNLIDAIHYLALTKSAFNTIEKENIRHGSQAFLIQSEWEIGGSAHQVVCSYQAGLPKTIRYDGKDYEKISEHIGRLPLVLVTPYDTDLIRGGSDGRRRFFDGILCQANESYLRDLIRYNHILRQRNALLKQSGGYAPDADLLKSYTDPLILLGRSIYEERRDFLESFLTEFRNYYELISENSEQVDIRYKSDGAEDLQSLFEQSLRKDIALERTTTGIHRDDFRFVMDGHAIRKYGSQGQQKSFVLALKLAQFAYLSEARETPPIILLDDIFDKLDRQRILQLMHILQGKGMGQVFITDAREERTRELLAETEFPLTFYKVENESIHEIK
ncbi:DNA replication/repair protein RecF [Fulvivirga sedimenti]|uniref:DNA replication and repair protein RecF n=1 Tax=Fulvivirga sedimenti TaxID=2879465 RepID=A0A9X1HTN6_9BACT|nr:DNA replication and repair protein RecF [Fulvivirga sedimenti]MCA6078099.1 DNA replication and repair protein RecF [Fulvivirga sedimenti]